MRERESTIAIKLWHCAANCCYRILVASPKDTRTHNYSNQIKTKQRCTARLELTFLLFSYLSHHWTLFLEQFRQWNHSFDKRHSLSQKSFMSCFFFALYERKRSLFVWPKRLNTEHLWHLQTVYYRILNSSAIFSSMWRKKQTHAAQFEGLFYG